MSLARQIVPADAAPDVRDLDIEVSRIRLDQSAQPREHLNTERTAEYAEAMKAGDQFPPLVVFFDGGTYWLADGFHRHYAAQQAGRTLIRCQVRPGGLREAILYSVGANARHGLDRTDEDKRRAVARLLADEEWSHWSDREIARRCRVSDKFVSKQRPAVSADHPQIARKVKRGGTVYTQKVAKVRAPVGAGARPQGGDDSKEITSEDVATQGVEGGAEAAASGEEITPAEPLQAAWDAADRQTQDAFLSSNGLTRKAVRGTRTSLSIETVAHVMRPALNRKPFVLRPHCLNREVCAGVGAEHCHTCKRAMAVSEVEQ